MTLTHGSSSGNTDDENRYQPNLLGESNQYPPDEAADNDVAASTTHISFHRRCGELITLSSHPSSSNSFADGPGRRWVFKLIEIPTTILSKQIYLKS